MPVLGHIGLTPQSLHHLGGFKVQGKTLDAARALLDDAKAVEDAGAFAVVLECIPAEVAAEITAAVSIPTVGIGAGRHCDGQVLVFHDLLGLYEGKLPRFVRRYGDFGRQMREALGRFRDDVRSGAFPTEAESFHLPDEVAEHFEQGGRRADPSAR
jgi:3-methyl-2-oxobutanoate hydroxymethyltransferase